MSKAELLDRLLFLENEKTRVICESTDANAWKKYYDMQIKELEAYAEQVAKEQRDIDYSIIRPESKDIAGMLKFAPLVTDNQQSDNTKP